MKAILNRIRISPKKANLIAGMVRGKKVKEALSLLKFMPKKGADILYKVVHSAASNAKNNFKQKTDDLVITKILVTKGPTYKRSIPISRGRMHPIRKRTSHITVEVGVAAGEEVKKVEAPEKQSAISKSADQPDKKEKVEKKTTTKKATTKRETAKKTTTKKTEAKKKEEKK
ncbi:50S ribosomal protein L22 [Patescibacteria group bacterium]|nr:50S ribosomal protein L22 [Patescibacteria group bacterium]